MVIPQLIRAKKLAEKLGKNKKPKKELSKKQTNKGSSKPESPLKGRHYSTITNREITREVDRLRKMATRTLEDPIAVDTGARMYFDMLKRFEGVVEESGLNTKQAWSNLRKHNEIIHRSFVDELKKFGSYQSVSVRSGRKQAQFAINTFGEDEWKEMSKDDRSRIWNTVRYYSDKENGYVLSSDQIVQMLRMVIEGPDFNLATFNAENAKMVTEGSMAGYEIYEIPELENKVERSDEGVKKRRDMMRGTLSGMRTKRKKGRIRF